MLHDIGREVHGLILAELAEIVDTGSLKPVLDSNDFSLDQVDAAYDRLASGNAIGKVVVGLQE